jgi:hypothetical protein
VEWLKRIALERLSFTLEQPRHLPQIRDDGAHLFGVGEFLK